MRILNSAQMREADRRCTGDIGIASIVLMENAGRQVVAAMEAMFPDLALAQDRRALRPREQRRRRVRRRAHAGAAGRRRVGLSRRGHRRGEGRRPGQSRRPGAARPHGDRDRRRGRLGAAVSRHPQRRPAGGRAVRHRPPHAAHRALRDDRRRHQRQRSAGGLGGPAVGPVGRHAGSRSARASTPRSP